VSGLKTKGQLENIIYVHKNDEQQYVISYGIQFKNFTKSLPESLQNVLLLKHQFDYGAFNMHTMLEYVENDHIDTLIKEDVNSYSDFCWVDFSEEEGLNELNGQEVAELLFLGHMKQHITPPFYSKLNNQFVYLAHDDGWFNKVYYRDFNSFYSVLGGTLAAKLSESKKERSFLGLKKKSVMPAVPHDVLRSLDAKLREGLIIAIEKTTRVKGKLEIPIWVMGDYYNMDEMYDDYQEIQKSPYNGLLVYDHKTKKWSSYTK
jgi:hypothetical protein